MMPPYTTKSELSLFTWTNEYASLPTAMFDQLTPLAPGSRWTPIVCQLLPGYRRRGEREEWVGRRSLQMAWNFNRTFSVHVRPSGRQLADNKTAARAIYKVVCSSGLRSKEQIVSNLTVEPSQLPAEKPYVSYCTSHILFVSVFPSVNQMVYKDALVRSRHRTVLACWSLHHRREWLVYQGLLFELFTPSEHYQIAPSTSVPKDFKISLSITSSKGVCPFSS